MAIIVRTPIVGGGVQFSAGPVMPSHWFFATVLLAAMVMWHWTTFDVSFMSGMMLAAWLGLAWIVVECCTTVEIITLLPDHGVQMEKRSWLSRHRTFVPKDMLCGVLINEVIRRHGVEDCLVVLRGQNGPRQAPEQIFPVFPYHRPDIEELVPIYQEASSLFPA